MLVLSRATPEELAGFYRFATGEHLESAECGVRNEECEEGSAEWRGRGAELKSSRAGCPPGSPPALAVSLCAPKASLLILRFRSFVRLATLSGESKVL